MRKVSITVAVGIVSLLMASCSGDSTSPPVAQTPTPVPATPTAAQPGKTEPFSQPTVPGKGQKVVVQTVQQPEKTIVVPGLIQSTNSDARVQQVQKGRTDPFAVIPVQPVVTILPAPINAPRSVPSLPEFPRIPTTGTALTGIPSNGQNRGNIITFPSNRTNTGRNTTTNTGRNTTTNTGRNTTTNTGRNTTRGNIARVNPPRTFPLPPISSVPTFKPELPKLPEPLLARGVEVSGVIQVDGIIQAIVKAPNESTSRYVGVGQRLSNGQVLVKRIEMIQGTSPVVVLEQYGIEVNRQVGEKGGTVTSQQPGLPTAAMPLSPSVNGNSSPQA